MSALETFRYHVADEAGPGDVEGRSAESFGAEVPGGPDPATAPSFTSDEAAARYYLDGLLRQDERPALRSVVEPERPERVPGLVVEGEQDLRPLGTRQVRFGQTHRTIPVFGASAVVELTPARDLVSVTAQLDEVTGVDAVESLTRADALRRVEEYTGTTIPADAAVAGRLTFYKDEEARAWHLAWLLPGLPAAPPVSADETPGERSGRERSGREHSGREHSGREHSGHGLGRRPVPPRVTYLVDAHDGTILFHFSAVPTSGPTAGPVPARCTGIDETETQQTFLGELAAAGGTRCRLADARRSIRTYDLRFADINADPPVPEPPVEAETSDYGATNRAAVSAHVNATRVYDFYKLVLQRNGIDDQGMVLVSQVNTTAASMQAPPSLRNAFWWDKKMWYGQVLRGGRLVSLSQYLDVIAHELTHGVIETTSNLVYATQSGALNESFADIAGVIINNWYTAPDPKDVATWNWEIGSGLDGGNRPLRDFANPARLGDPEHMDDFRHLRPGERPNDLNDQGWVHVNSNIHNKAVHNLLTASRNGQRVFTVEDVALLTYLGMTRLAPLATFTDALQAVVDVAQSYFGGDRNRQVKIDAIRDAYGRAGIG